MESPKLSYFVTMTGFGNRRLVPERFRTRLEVVVGNALPSEGLGHRRVVAAGWEGDRYVVHVA